VWVYIYAIKGTGSSQWIYFGGGGKHKVMINIVISRFSQPTGLDAMQHFVTHSFPSLKSDSTEVPGMCRASGSCG
jgi:hypothetical protein